MTHTQPTIVFIHGGETHATKEHFYKFLHTVEINPFEKKKKWRDPLFATLEQDKFTVITPSMPGGWTADYTAWSIRFEKHLPFFSSQGVILIGYSLGGVFLAKRLQNNTLGIPIHQLHLVAAPYDNTDLINEDLCDFAIEQDSLPNTGSQCKQIHIYQSSDDPYIPTSHTQKYKAALPSSRLHEFTDRNHFFQEEFPELLASIYLRDQ